MSLEISWDPPEGPGDKDDWERIIREATGYDDPRREPIGGLDVILVRLNSEWAVKVKDYPVGLGVGHIPTPPAPDPDRHRHEVLKALRAAGKPAV